MAALILPSRRVVQPQGPVEVDGGSPLGRSLGFCVSDFSGRDVVGQRFVTRSASLAYGTTALGRGFSSAADAAFSAQLDLSGTSEITVAFILKRNTETGAQVLIEHTINQNNQAGSFLIYTDTTNFLASISNGLGGAANFNVASCAAPAIGRTTKVVVTLARRGTSAKACRIWYDGVEQVTTQPNTGSISGAFANSTTYFFGRAATSIFANGVIHDASIWLRSLADAEVAQWSANPWQLFRPIQRRIWVPVAGGATIITASQSGSWSVRNNVSALQAGAWSVRNLAATTQAGAWSVRTSVATTQAAAWSVRNYASASQSGAFSVRNYSAATQPSAWSIRNLASALQAGAWSVENAAGTATALQSGSWSVRNLAAATQPASWSVRNTATTTAPGAWSVRNAVQATQAGAWKVSVYAAALQGSSWTVRNYAGATQAGAWSLDEAGRVTASQPGRWSVRNLVATTQPGAWSVASNLIFSRAPSGGGYGVTAQKTSRPDRLQSSGRPATTNTRRP